MAHHEERTDKNIIRGQKGSAAKRTLNPWQGGRGRTADGNGPSDQQHDIKGRQGSFAGKGDHARTGNRGHQ